MRYLMLVMVAVAYLAYVNSDACVQCNSAKEPECATNPNQYMAKECKNATSKCYTRISGTNTIRGCATELDNSTASKCNNEMECLICTFMEGCNRQVFPQHRTQCLQCSGNSTNSTCATETYAKPTVCNLYALGDKCFIRNTNRNGTAGSFQRGCLTSAKANKLCLKEENCFLCDGVGCNSLEALDTLIPLARDSAGILISSMTLLLASIVTLLVNA